MLDMSVRCGSGRSAGGVVPYVRAYAHANRDEALPDQRVSRRGNQATGVVTK